MALRSEKDSSNSPLPGVTYFWQDADKPPNYDWDQWVQFFEVAVLARHPISRTELLQTVGKQHLREAALMGNLEETPAKRIVVSLLYIDIGKTGRKMFMDKFPNINILLIQLSSALH